MCRDRRSVDVVRPTAGPQLDDGARTTAVPSRSERRRGGGPLKSAEVSTEASMSAVPIDCSVTSPP